MTCLTVAGTIEYDEFAWMMYELAMDDDDIGMWHSVKQPEDVPDTHKQLIDRPPSNQGETQYITECCICDPCVNPLLSPHNR
jgi:hypothetical protein